MLSLVCAGGIALTPSLSPVGARKLGTLRVSECGLGTLNLALDNPNDPGALGALTAAVTSGCNFVDTAEAYGFGVSEKQAAWASKKAGVSIGTGPEDLVVATKFAPLPWRPDADSVVEACKASAERLGVSQIPLYQIHWPDIIQPFKPIGLEKRKDKEYWEGLVRCYEMGLVANIGCCNYGPQMTCDFQAYLEARGVPLASNQINFSLLYRKESAATRAACEALGVPLIAYFPLANVLSTAPPALLEASPLISRLVPKLRTCRPSQSDTRGPAHAGTANRPVRC